jgi:hypothetical protein
MLSDRFHVPIDRLELVLVDRKTVSEALSFVTRCEACAPDAEIPFDSILDRITEKDPSVTDYLIEATPPCPFCRHEVTEKTLVKVC